MRFEFSAVLRAVALSTLAALLANACTPAHAQPYPSRPVKFVIPYPPGGLADTFARTLGQQLSDRLGQPVVPENKPGGSLIIGTDAVAKSPADGYTLLLASSSGLALNVAAFRKLPYDPLKDFAPISLAFYTPLYLMVSPDLPVTSVRDLVAYAKAKPNSLSFASLGHGSSLHLAGEMFKSLAGIEILHVPYKGTTTALPDLMSGRVSMMFDGGAFLPQVQAGKVRLLAVTSTKRLDSLPDVPTMAEAGVPGYEVVFWFGLAAPGGTPKPIVDRLSKEINEIVKSPSFREKLSGFGNIQYATNTPEAFSELIKTDIRFWNKVLRDAKVEPQ
jgi:tripartite-type tricarboxylate transporter receptor subunit TctC